MFGRNLDNIKTSKYKWILKYRENWESFEYLQDQEEYRCGIHDGYVWKYELFK
jgi:hypothetical protein